MTQKFFLPKKSKKIPKNADFESVEKVVKNAPKKSYKQNKFDEHK